MYASLITSNYSSRDNIRWSRLGLQGGMLSLLLQPIYLSGIIVGLDVTARSSVDQYNALERSVRIRLQCCEESQISDIRIKSALTTSISIPETKRSGNSLGNEFYSESIVEKDANEDMINDSKIAKCNVDDSQRFVLPFVPMVYITSRHDNPETAFRFSKSTADFINHSSSNNMCSSSGNCGSVINDNIDRSCSSTSKIVNPQEYELQALNKTNDIEINKNLSVEDCYEHNDQASCQKTVESNQGEKSSKLRIAKRIVPCGTSINWVRDVISGTRKEIGGAEGDNIESRRKRLKYCGNGTIEVTVADTGALQGKNFLFYITYLLQSVSSSRNIAYFIKCSMSDVI